MNESNRREFLELTIIGIAALTGCSKREEIDTKKIPIQQEVYRFKIGEFDCISFNDGYHNYNINFFFDKIPTELIQKELGLPEDQTTVSSTYACLYIDTGDNKVMIDTGRGKARETTGRLQSYLRQENIAPDSVDTVIITHTHADHTGGLLDEDGNLLFPNAQIYCAERERNFWMTDEVLKIYDEGAFFFKDARRIFEAIKDKLTCIESDSEIIPGITALDGRGHTPGQIAVVVSSEGEKLMYISDVVFHPLHLKHQDWLPVEGLMIEPEEFFKTKRRILNKAADENMLVSAMHFTPAPSLGYVTKQGDGWNWQPITRNSSK